MQSEKFEGILIPLFKKMLDTNTKEGFESMKKHRNDKAESL